jgi:hypothetical protein
MKAFCNESGQVVLELVHGAITDKIGNFYEGKFVSNRYHDNNGYYKRNPVAMFSRELLYMVFLRIDLLMMVVVTSTMVIVKRVTVMLLKMAEVLIFVTKVCRRMIVNGKMTFSRDKAH